MLVTLLANDFWRSGFSVMGGLIVLSPIVHYWYVSWALVFVPLFPSLAWLTLSGTIALYFLVGLTPTGRCRSGRLCFIIVALWVTAKIPDRCSAAILSNSLLR